MKKAMFIMVLVSVAVIFASTVTPQVQTEEGTVFGQEGEDTDILPGMQAISVGSAKVIIPKGAELKKVTPGLVVPQTAGEYTAEELPALKEKILQIEGQVDQMERQETTKDKEAPKKERKQDTEDSEDTEDTHTPGILIAG